MSVLEQLPPEARQRLVLVLRARPVRPMRRPVEDRPPVEVRVSRETAGVRS